jgi:hypothetical protein
MEIEDKINILLPYISLSHFTKMLYEGDSASQVSKFRQKLNHIEVKNGSGVISQKKFSQDEKERLEKIIENEIKKLKIIIEKF